MKKIITIFAATLISQNLYSFNPSDFEKFKNSGFKECINCDLTRINFTDQKTLENVDLSGSDLSGSLFNGLNMNGANLKGTTLNGTRFEGSQLNNAHFDKARGKRANFFGAILNGANFLSTEIVHSNFIDAKLNKATLNRSTFNCSNFTGAQFKEAKIIGKSNMPTFFTYGPDSTRSSLVNTDFSNATIEGYIAFEDSDTKNAKFNGAIVTDEGTINSLRKKGIRCNQTSCSTKKQLGLLDVFKRLIKRQ